jgi:hypothetical protein
LNPPNASDQPEPTTSPTEVQPEQVSSPESAAPAEPETTAEPAQELLSWEASEYVYHDKQFLWYLAVVAAAAVAVGLSIWLKQWVSAGVFVIMAAAVIVYERRQPEILHYGITDQGLLVGERFYSFHQFKSFSVMADVGWHSIELEPVQRFMPRLAVLFDNQNLDSIVELLSSHLPMVQRNPDIIDRVSRALKF